jgi:hypothetical protein
MNFVEDRLLDRLFCVVVNYPARAVFYLYHPNAPPADVFTQSKVQSPPKCSIFLPLYYCKDLVLCSLVLLFLRPLKALIQVLPLMLFPVLSKIIAFFFADAKPEFGIVDSQLKWCGDLTSPCCLPQVPAIAYLPGVPMQ